MCLQAMTISCLNIEQLQFNSIMFTFKSLLSTYEKFRGCVKCCFTNVNSHYIILIDIYIKQRKNCLIKYFLYFVISTLGWISEKLHQKSNARNPARRYN